MRTFSDDLKDAVNREHYTWTQLCKQLAHTVGMTKDQFNESAEMRKLVKYIEQWGYSEFVRRICLKAEKNKYWDQPSGVFWDGNSMEAEYDY